MKEYWKYKNPFHYLSTSTLPVNSRITIIYNFTKTILEKHHKNKINNLNK